MNSLRRVTNDVIERFQPVFEQTVRVSIEGEEASRRVSSPRPSSLLILSRGKPFRGRRRDPFVSFVFLLLSPLIVILRSRGEYRRGNLPRQADARSLLSRFVLLFFNRARLRSPARLGAGISRRIRGRISGTSILIALRYLDWNARRSRLFQREVAGVGR